MSTPEEEIEEDLRQLRKYADHFKERRARAVSRLETHGKEGWCFALLGFSMEADQYPLGHAAEIRTVHEPPVDVELARALRDKRLISLVARYSYSIRYELTVPARPEAGLEGQDVFNYAWALLTLIRIRSLREFLVPVAANRSWSVVAGSPDDSIEVRIVEDLPQSLMFEPLAPTSLQALDWVAAQFSSFVKLLKTPGFRLATEALATHHHQASPRMTVASLWAGIEALVGVQSELRFRTAAYVASALEPRGNGRLALVRSLKKDYDLRSKAVHGAAVTDAELAIHVRRVRETLSRLICSCIEKGAVPTDSDFESMMFAEC